MDVARVVHVGVREAEARPPIFPVDVFGIMRGLFSVIPFASDPKAVLSVMLISRRSGGIRKSVLGCSVRTGDDGAYFALPEYLITRKLKFLAKAAATSVGAIAVGCCW